MLVASAALLGGGYTWARTRAAKEDRSRNRITHPGPYPASSRSLQLIAQTPLADLHADSLLWDRDLLARNTRGHLDLPRLLETHAALQLFSVVTQVPDPLRMRGNGDTTDGIRKLALVERWPPRTWASRFERARYQADKLKAFAARSHGQLRLIRTRAELDALLADRRAGKAVVGGVLSLEGAQALEGKLSNVDRLYDAGFRVIGLAHFFDNQAAGSAHGKTGEGLTPFGRQLIPALEARGMIVDLAHASPRTLDDVATIATRPFIVSHTGVRATCDSPRNLTDAQLRKVAASGGVVGIGYWKVATCGTDARAVARSVKHAIDVIGAEHVALGSDFDGAVAMPFDVTGVPMLLDALRAEGLSEEQLRLVIGENVVRVLRQSWGSNTGGPGIEKSPLPSP